MRSIALLALCAACYSPTFVDCEVTCATSQTCPSGLTCNAGRCVSDTSVDCTATPDAMIDAPGTPTGPWGAPQPVMFNGAASSLDDDPTLTDDMLEMWVHRSVPATGENDIYAVRRATVTDPWGAFSKVNELSPAATAENTPEVSGDGLTIYLVQGPSTNTDVFMATRPTRSALWGNAAAVTPLNSATADTSPTMSRDQLTMVIASTRGSSSSDLFLTNRASATAAWNMPLVMGMISNPNLAEESPFLSSDKLTIYFSAVVGTQVDLFTATRPTLSGGVFNSPMPITELNSTGDDSDPWVSPDGRTIYFTRTQGGVTTIMRATR